MGVNADNRAAHDTSAAEGGVDRVPLLPLLRREILVERTEVQIVEGFLLRFRRFTVFFLRECFIPSIELSRFCDCRFFDLRLQCGLRGGKSFFRIDGFWLHGFFLQHFGFGFLSGHM